MKEERIQVRIEERRWREGGKEGERMDRLEREEKEVDESEERKNGEEREGKRTREATVTHTHTDTYLHPLPPLRIHPHLGSPSLSPSFAAGLDDDAEKGRRRQGHFWGAFFSHS